MIGFYDTRGAELTPQNEPKRCILFSNCLSLCCIYADNYLYCHLCVYLVELELSIFVWYGLLTQTTRSTSVLHLILFKHDHVFTVARIFKMPMFYKKRGRLLSFVKKKCPEMSCCTTFLTFVFATINLSVEHYVNLVCVLSYWATVSY